MNAFEQLRELIRLGRIAKRRQAIARARKPKANGRKPLLIKSLPKLIGSGKMPTLFKSSTGRTCCLLISGKAYRSITTKRK